MTRHLKEMNDHDKLIRKIGYTFLAIIVAFGLFLYLT